ncbi:xanthine dehydrogenase small subunit [Marinobacter segnicrescens]|uniref:Xanthine dehydrogenase small subunit n=1 Tax=Marinobacter segnicrescens TaxID=430453 RepID=A0A1I0BQL5_9GAMM|nr:MULTISPECIES: xanthine dehydrogenase small subunit [Marinobacter]UZD67200.1 xanthine dehydrogenase small subunit [Marinobacter sp. AN1]SET08929.1 xanthine dehydrogenase small subunit [Marinobacter segnicrescens]
MIEFVLNGRTEKVDQVDPNLSILEWLRTKMRLTGTKEGCASGDCGACTVIIGTPDPQGNIRYEAINSCISLVGNLHGKELITVEAFQQEPGHPVQRAMMEKHGAQCGFCTPGIVMSLVALHANREGTTPDDHRLLEALSGNLCRCTGYRPIIDAGRQALVQEWTPGAAHPAAGLGGGRSTGELNAINRDSISLQAPDGPRYDAPVSLDELRALRREFPDSRLVAGSTDLALEITQQLKTLDHMISVERVEELTGCERQGDELVIGAAATYQRFRGLLSGLWPAFDPMLERLGSLQIRNRGTLGGNIANASPIGDMPPPLIALGATLVLDGPDGERRLPLEDFFHGYKQTDLKPGEFVHSVRLPVPRANEQLYLYKVSKRLDDDISAVLGAFRLTVDNGVVADCRLAFGGMAATPARAIGAETALKDQPWNDDSVTAAISALASDFSPLTDVRASAGYRLQVAGNLLRRALLASTSSETLMVTGYA